MHDKLELFYWNSISCLFRSICLGCLFFIVRKWNTNKYLKLILFELSQLFVVQIALCMIFSGCSCQINLVAVHMYHIPSTTWSLKFVLLVISMPQCEIMPFRHFGCWMKVLLLRFWEWIYKIPSFSLFCLPYCSLDYQVK